MANRLSKKVVLPTWFFVVALILAGSTGALAQHGLRTWTDKTIGKLNDLMGPRSGWSWSQLSPPDPDTPQELTGELHAIAGLTQWAFIGNGLVVRARLDPVLLVEQFELFFTQNPPAFYSILDASTSPPMPLTLCPAPVGAGDVAVSH